VIADVDGEEARLGGERGRLLGRRVLRRRVVEAGREAERAAEAFCGLFRGENFGRRLVRLSPDPA